MNFEENSLIFGEKIGLNQHAQFIDKPKQIFNSPRAPLVDRTEQAYLNFGNAKSVEARW